MFIVIDGPDGSGKSTLSEALAGQLRAQGHSVLHTFEPTDTTETSREIRRYLHCGDSVDPRVLCDLFTKDRAEHVSSVILPHLAQGGVVICDRYKYSAFVYQSSQGVDRDYVIRSNAAFPVPDVTFVLLPSSADVLMRRIARRGKAEEAFERSGFLTRAIEVYRHLPDYFPNEKFVFLDADLPTEQNLSLIEPHLS